MAAGDRNNPQRADSSDSQYSIMEFMKDFPDDAACVEWLWRTRYSADGEHAMCSRCGIETPFRKYQTKQQRQSWTCTKCGLHVHPTSGTIFHKSSTSLQLWFYAVYLMTSTRCGISAKQIERELGVTYKTAWRMCHLIRRELMPQESDRLEGDVELDETFVGGRPRLKDRVRKPDGSFKPGKSAKKKAMVVGAVERGGRVRAIVKPEESRLKVGDHAREMVLPESVIFTDEYVGYDQFGRGQAGHHRINHSERVYVSGDVHTQTIEGFWSLVKNGIRGVYHAVSAKHLQTYLNEYAWRYNRRHDPAAMFMTVLLNSAQECQSAKA